MRNYSYENDFDLHENEIACRTHFHMKGFALRLVLKQRHKRTRKWPIPSTGDFRYRFIGFCHMISLIASNKIANLWKCVEFSSSRSFILRTFVSELNLWFQTNSCFQIHLDFSSKILKLKAIFKILFTKWLWRNRKSRLKLL